MPSTPELAESLPVPSVSLCLTSLTPIPVRRKSRSKAGDPDKIRGISTEISI